MLFTWFGLPAAVMSGSMLAVGLAALLGVPVEIPDKLRGFSFFFAGAFFGSTVDQETVAALPHGQCPLPGSRFV